MRLEEHIRVLIIRFGVWQADRYIRKAAQANHEAQEWIACARQHWEALEGGEAL